MTLHVRSDATTARDQPPNSRTPLGKPPSCCNVKADGVAGKEGVGSVRDAQALKAYNETPN
ncbi:hypothetical protein DFP72DRAFT_1072286 [Ephemerocybe angulata]|uniref:Uncharacterized protein n=1 Tax=Ephemerocybe angulata TaxID=980116 RepID=A0A8H6HP21_9AGAR|nr:hypothetical protein DFP72DRAFT_1072286 [Tulosesus angulatus]